jgi:hypothetical protein
MESVADFKDEYQPQSWERLKASIRTRIRTYVPGSIQETNHRPAEITLAG